MCFVSYCSASIAFRKPRFDKKPYRSKKELDRDVGSYAIVLCTSVPHTNTRVLYDIAAVDHIILNAPPSEPLQSVNAACSTAPGISCVIDAKVLFLTKLNFCF